MPDPYEHLKSLADPFIELANRMSGQHGPESTGDGFLYGCARYMAFLVARTAETQQVPRGEVVAGVADAFSKALFHHMAQIAGPMDSYESPPSYAQEMQDDEMTRALSEAINASMRASQYMDVTLVAYLRGSGNHKLADRLFLGAVDVRDNKDWDLDYARRVLKAHEDGDLSKPLTLATLMAILTERMQLESTSGIVLDPAISDEGRKQHSDFFTRHGLYKLATMVRKDPAAFLASALEGERDLIGPVAETRRKLFDKLRLRNSH